MEFKLFIIGITILYLIMGFTVFVGSKTSPECHWWLGNFSEFNAPLSRISSMKLKMPKILDTKSRVKQQVKSKRGIKSSGLPWG